MFRRTSTEETNSMSNIAEGIIHAFLWFLQVPPYRRSHVQNLVNESKVLKHNAVGGINNSGQRDISAFRAATTRRNNIQVGSTQQHCRNLYRTEQRQPRAQQAIPHQHEPTQHIAANLTCCNFETAATAGTNNQTASREWMRCNLNTRSHNRKRGAVMMYTTIQQSISHVL